MRYSTITIQRACRLYKEGRKIREILAETGIRGHSVIYFHCDPEKKARHLQRCKEWRERNPERWKAIVRRAMAKYKQVHLKNEKTYIRGM